MRGLTGFMLVALVAVALGCGGSGATTTTAPPSTTATTLAPTTTTPVGNSDVQAARAQLQTDVAALKASLEGLGTLSLSSTKADLTAARDNIQRSWNTVKQSAAALKATATSQVQGTADQLQSAVDVVQQAWDCLTTLVDDVQSGQTTMVKAIDAVTAYNRQ